MRLPNVKMLLRWPSKMRIYGFVENHTFLEQFVNMGVPRHFPICRNFCWIFCVTILWYFCEVLLVAGDFILLPLHMTMVWSMLLELESRHRATPLMFALANINQH